MQTPFYSADQLTPQAIEEAVARAHTMRSEAIRHFAATLFRRSKPETAPATSLPQNASYAK
jgi:hypothetical protein